jgi:hypothetical protein
LATPQRALLMATVSTGLLWLASPHWSAALQLLDRETALLAVACIFAVHGLPLATPFLALLTVQTRTGQAGEASAVALDGVGMVLGTSVSVWLAHVAGYGGLLLVAMLVFFGASLVLWRR